MITMEERTQKFTELTLRMIEVQRAKGHDYAEDEDGLFNLRRRGQLGIIDRMDDKLVRLRNLIKKGTEPQVRNESIEDTLIDIANYSILLIILREDLSAVSSSIPPGHTRPPAPCEGD